MPRQMPAIDEILEGADVLAEVANEPDSFLRIGEEIHDLDPLVDAERLAELHRQLRLAIERAEGSDQAIGRSLLDLVAARQSPVGASVLALLETRQERFTPALVRALWEARELPRGERELRNVLSDEALLQFMTRDLVHAGVLTRTGGEDRTFRLTPAGRHALGPISRKVLALELGRFPWPDNVRAAGDWAREEGLEIYPFRHSGEDGAQVAQCIGEENFGPLSVPNLFGVAGPEPNRVRPSEPFHALAVLCGPLAFLHDEAVDARMHRILDDRQTLARRTTARDVDWDLTLFADKGFQKDFGPIVQAACDQADVSCSFAG